MTDAARGTRSPARVPHHSRRRAVLAVPLIALLGALALAFRAMPVEGESLGAFLANPAVWGARFVPAMGSIADLWVRTTLTGLASGALVFLMGSGLTLIWAMSGLVGAGRRQLIGVLLFTGLCIGALATGPGTHLDPALGLGAVLAAVWVALSVTGAPGLGLGQVSVARLHDRRVTQILMTCAAVLVVRVGVLLVWGGAPVGVDRPEALTGSVLIAGLPLQTLHVLGAALAITVLGVFWLGLSHTRTGLVLRAGVRNAEVTGAMGYRSGGLAIGAGLAGLGLVTLGSTLWAFDAGALDARVATELMVMVFGAILLGGMGSIAGCFVGGLCVGLIHSLGAIFVPDMTGVPVICLVLIGLLVRPAGLFGRPVRPEP